MAATAIHNNHFNARIQDLNSVTGSKKNSEIISSSNEEASNSGETTEENQKEIDIVINNVVCSFNVRCHLNLRDIALRGLNVEYRKENGMLKWLECLFKPKLSSQNI